MLQSLSSVVLQYSICPKDEDEIANSVDPGRTALILAFTVCATIYFLAGSLRDFCFPEVEDENPKPGEYGFCGVALIIFSFLMVLVTLPFSLVMCIKVSETAKP